MSSIIIEQADATAWGIFRSWADDEGWRIPPVELDLFAGPWQQYGWIARNGETPVGFVTAVPHARSGWIGNLIVPQNQRGLGIGSLLFDFAVRALDEAGCSTLWLTASPLGQPIYGKRGFQACGHIDRWVRTPDAPRNDHPVFSAPAATLMAADYCCWGEERTSLCQNLTTDSIVLNEGASTLLLQPASSSMPLQVAGPWYHRDPSRSETESLLCQLTALHQPGCTLAVDILRGAVDPDLCRAHRFTNTGSTTLMHRGRLEPDTLETLVGLASLGSFG